MIVILEKSIRSPEHVEPMKDINTAYLIVEVGNLQNLEIIVSACKRRVTFMPSGNKDGRRSWRPVLIRKKLGFN